LLITVPRAWYELQLQTSCAGWLTSDNTLIISAGKTIMWVRFECSEVIFC